MSDDDIGSMDDLSWKACQLQGAGGLVLHYKHDDGERWIGWFQGQTHHVVVGATPGAVVDQLFKLGCATALDKLKAAKAAEGEPT